ncbi:MAG TPA: serine/threonine-protein kinase [Opitutaceae bacterium]
MNPAPDNEEDLFAAALGLPRVERTAFLERACAGEPNLRGRVEALLAASEAAGDFLQEPDAEARLADDRPGNQLREENVGDRIGRYKLLQKIGEGGFGTVWMAEQEEPVRRRVALKVLKAGLDTKEVVARFESERQALALMDHPNIARVFDGGATASGRPFFVMELVRGVPITTYCDEHRLPADERLRLFIAVCQAVQHAHQKGVIHRDLKPSNILVTLHDDASVPKVIDFGIAKAIEGRLTDKTLVTQFHAFIGTPVYSSPEQVEMSALDVDTRSDIYSLGVLLYELLTGRPPFDPETLTKAGLESMRRTIREVDPPRPSTRLGTLSDEDRTSVARQRGTDPRALSTLLRGDIDWIMMRCLEKNRARRYETANGLALDIQRHLDHEPVMARSPTTGYRLRKLMRRNKLAFVSGGAIAAALLLGSIVSTWQAVRATQARRSEAAARAVAQSQELAVRQRAYASDMNLAMQALRVNDLGRVHDLLDRQRPKPGERDLRGWEWRYLWQQSRSDALATLCQKSEICSLAASADGRWLAIGAVYRDGLFIWDLETGTEVEHLAPGTAMVRAAFSTVEPVVAYASTLFLPDGSGTGKTTLRLWNAATRKTTAEILLDDPCNGLAFGQDGKRLLTSTGSILTGRSALTLWTLPEGTRVACFPQKNHAEASKTPFAVTADLRLVAHAPHFGQIGVLDLATGRAMWTATVAFPGEKLSAAAFSPDGKNLATASGHNDIDIHLWDVSSGVETGRLEGHGNWIAALVFLPDGRKLVSASADQTLRTWDVASRECLDVMRGHRAEVWRLALLPDGRTRAGGSKDGVVSLWDVSVNHPRRERITWPEPVADWRFSGDGGSIITASPEGTVARWSGPEYAEKEILLETGEALLEVRAIRLVATFSADGRLFAKRLSDEGI